MVAFSVKDIRAAVSPAAFGKAMDYAHQGRVLEYSVTDNGHIIRARTQGDARKPYAQEISVEPQSSGRVDFEGTCSCPMAYNCKHVAAVLLDVLSEEDGMSDNTLPPRPPSLEAALPHDIATWLGALDAARGADDEAYPDDQTTRIFYILSTVEVSDGAVPRLMVRPVSVRLRSDGSLPQRVSKLSLGYDAPLFARPADRRILRHLVGGWSDGDHEIRKEEAGDMLKRILATGRARWLAIDGATLREGPPLPALVAWRIRPNGSQSPVIEVPAGVKALHTTPAWYIDAKSGAMGPLEFDTPPALTAALLGAPDLAPTMVERVREQMARRLKGASVPMPAELAEPEKLRGRPTPCLRLLPGRLPLRRHGALVGGSSVLTGVAELSFLYGPIRVSALLNLGRISAAHQGKLYTIERHKTGENDAERLLAKLGLKRVPMVLRYATPEPHRTHFMLERGGDDLAWLDLLFHDVPALRAKGWHIEIADDFPHRLVRYDGEIDAEVTQGSGIDWFDLDLGVEIDGSRIDLVPPLLAFLAAGKGAEMPTDPAATIFVPLEDGRRLAVPAARVLPLLTALAALFRSTPADGGAERLRFSTMDAADLAALEAATAAAGVVWRGGEALRALGHRLRRPDGVPNVAVPAAFGASLRAYQQRGVDWLQFLREVGFGGVLADDMGLGKTVQTLAHLLIEKESGRMDRPALIVCPTSLVANWLNEAQRFAPSLSVLTLHGAARKTRFDDIASHDVVITTYPLLARDHEVLTRQSWHVAVLDEAQMIKNPDALTARLAGKLDARQRLCLSGTPLENHLGELWSLFSFAAPGFLGERRGFNTRYRVPIERQGDTTRRAALAARVRPFILRRTKDEVLSDLPPKTEISEAVELGEGQRALYEAIRLAMHARVRDAIAKAGLARSQIMILDALLKLRQACCDPRLVKLDLPRAKKAAKGEAPGSAKLDRVMEMVPAMIEEGRRILLFSQFTSMLALIEAALDQRGVSYALLTGETRDRASQINRFQSGKVPLFLISLKAGGQGLNLTAADTVIHYDPWWNPAVEDQASARAHRIGQTKPVFVHKLKTVGTIEEKMETLKARKRDLVAGILGGALKSNLALSASDVEALFASA